MDDFLLWNLRNFADIALALNILLIFGILAGLGAVLTLPGIAGIVLTIGISVDANVLIFERVREELTKGKGNERRLQMDLIMPFFYFDANITTGLTALNLYLFLEQDQLKDSQLPY